MAWHYGKKCDYKEEPETKKQILIGILPAVTAINFFGFGALFTLFVDGFATIALYSLISAVLLSLMVVTIAIPELKRTPHDGNEQDARSESGKGDLSKKDREDETKSFLR